MTGFGLEVVKSASCFSLLFTKPAVKNPGLGYKDKKEVKGGNQTTKIRRLQLREIVQ